MLAIIPDHLYKEPGDETLYIALHPRDCDRLAPINGGAERYRTPSTQHYAPPGSGEWIAAMLTARTTLASKLSAEEQKCRTLQTWRDGVSQALLEKAEENGWCEEYEEFAEKWDLPKRNREFWVTVVVSVDAKDREAAEREIEELLRRPLEEYEMDITVEERGD